MSRNKLWAQFNKIQTKKKQVSKQKIQRINGTKSCFFEKNKKRLTNLYQN
jgi:hypothetical protein